jgi:DNA polymerase-3 subunit alpha
MYLKVYYPSVFFASTMEMFTFSNKFNEYLKESKDASIRVLLPSVNHSELSFKSISDSEILYGLAHLKGLNTLTSKAIIKEASEKQFSDYSDFVFRMSKYKLTQNQYEILIDAGALDEFKLNRATCKHNLDRLLKYADMFGYLQDGQMNFDFDVMEKPHIDIVSEDVNKLELEKEVLGFYISEFPLSRVRDNLIKQNVISIKNINNYNNKYVDFVGLLKSNKIIKTKKGELMNIATFVDEYGEISVVIFPNLYKEISKDMYIGRYYFVKGKIEVKEVVSLVANEIREYVLKE